MFEDQFGRPDRCLSGTGDSVTPSDKKNIRRPASIANVVYVRFFYNPYWKSSAFLLFPPLRLLWMMGRASRFIDAADSFSEIEDRQITVENTLDEMLSGIAASIDETASRGERPDS